MKHLNKRVITAFIAVFLIYIPQSWAQDDCEVELDEIAGEYEGDCRRGLAHGEGIAKGEDTYEGEFRRGLPHGEGTYTYANGDIYEGEFSKGLRDGEGEMKTLQADGKYETITGYWEKGEYIGEHQTPYEVQYRSPGVLSARVTETENPAGDGDALFIEILHKGKTQHAPNFNLSVNSGEMLSKFPVGVNTKVLVSRFPFSFRLSYMGESVEIEVYHKKSWKISLDFNK